MQNEAQPSIWKAWVVTAVFVAPITWGFMAYTRVPRMLVLAIGGIVSLALAHAVNDRMKRR